MPSRRALLPATSFSKSLQVCQKARGSPRVFFFFRTQLNFVFVFWSVNVSKLHSYKRAERHMQTKTNQRTGFTLVEIMIVVAIIGLLAAIAIPNFIKARQASQKAACVANLKTIDGAKATWALEQRKTNSDVPQDADLFGATSYIR